MISTGLTDGRLCHMRGVGLRAQELGKELFDWDERKCLEMFVLGFLHDIGYQISDNQTHAHAGADMLGSVGFKYFGEVYYHGDPDSEYESDELFILNLADMETSNVGERATLDERLKGIKERYGEESTQYADAYKVAERLKSRLVELGKTA